jgi:branched-chain amino acid aminotransferase
MTMGPDGPLALAHNLSTSRVPDDQRAEMLVAPGFGRTFTDHMITIEWSRERGWFDGQIRPYGPLTLDPSTNVFHYGQAIFEGLKAYSQPDGSVATFRPEENAARLQRSAERMALPRLEIDTFLAAVDLLVSTDRAWVPLEREKSLYLRPFMIATEPGLGVRPADEVMFVVIASPSGAYFPAGLKPVSIWLSEHYTRASPGGTGAAKTAGNYAASLVAQQEATEHGCAQVCFLDAAEHKWIEELGGMNLFFVYDDGSVVTPELNGTILAGVTRSSLLTLAEERGHKAVERRVSIDEWRTDVEAGHITEVFACGTAAVISSLDRLVWSDGELAIRDDVGPVAMELREALLDVQHGAVEDTHGWMHTVA